MLCETRTDMVLEILLIAVGAVIGTIPAAIATIYKYFTATPEAVHKLQFGDFLQVLIFASGLSVSICVGLVYRRRAKRSQSLQEQIRSRTST
ncbi:hypothetical protein GC1_17925 [Leisingera sp. ANG1]|nr:hypothetical protein RA23_19545 [Leisingera sp. ANG-S3]KIC53491.1 hypothetical protein RA22_09480 [Leisingera sp. ANG-S]KID07886.1 hypothetical protein GC1_17925 [Leisingera sp. ANG1]